MLHALLRRRIRRQGDLAACLAIGLAVISGSIVVGGCIRQGKRIIEVVRRARESAVHVDFPRIPDGSVVDNASLDEDDMVVHQGHSAVNRQLLPTANGEAPARGHGAAVDLTRVTFEDDAVPVCFIALILNGACKDHRVATVCGEGTWCTTICLIIILPHS